MVTDNEDVACSDGVALGVKDGCIGSVREQTPSKKHIRNKKVVRNFMGMAPLIEQGLIAVRCKTYTFLIKIGATLGLGSSLTVLSFPCVSQQESLTRAADLL